MSADAAPTVGVVIPTLDRRRDLRRCLDSVREQTRAPDMVLVVDNGSTDGTREDLRGAEGVTPLLLDENAGAPGGFEAGMRAAFRAGARWAWLLDDDCVPERDALEVLMRRVADAPGDDLAGAAPTVEFGDGRREAGWLWGSRAEGGRGQSPNRPTAGGGAPATEVDWAPFAGLLLSREACQEAGPIRTDFVLWHADVEYCLRMRADGRRLLAAPGATVRHPAMAMVSRRLLGRTFTVGRIPPWREYYDTRNRCLMWRDLRHTPLAARAPLTRRLAEEIARDAAVLLADRRGPRRVAMRALGLIDGLRGHTGRRPERGAGE